MSYLALMLLVLMYFFGSYLGAGAAVVVGLLGLLLVRGLFQGFTGGEAARMLLRRRLRTFAWATILGGIPAALYFGSMEVRASGSRC
jgi:hypothetical protein